MSKAEDLINSMVYIDTPASLIFDVIKDAIKKSAEMMKSGNVSELSEEASRQEISLRMAKEQARVAQEIAIARRIETAEEVTIEEYYDKSGDASVGFKSNGKSKSLGINGAGKQVTKRVYTFKGCHNMKSEISNSIDDNIDNTNEDS